MKKTVIVYVLLFLSSCSLIFSNDFVNPGSRLKRFPAHLEGDWVRTAIETTSFIERFSIKKSSFLVKFSGSDAEGANEVALSDSVRINYLEPFYVLQTATERGILISIFTCSGDTMRLFEPNLPEMETTLGQERQTGNLGVQQIRLDERSVEIVLNEPEKYLVPGDFFVKQKRRSSKRKN